MAMTGPAATRMYRRLKLAWAFVLALGRGRPDDETATPATISADDPATLIAELRRAKDAAEAANLAKTRYMVAVSHEIRSPLNAIHGYAQLLERGGAVTPAEAGGAIRRSSEHLTNLVEGLLEISRIESGVVKVRSDAVQLPNLLAHVIDMFRVQADAKGLELRYEVHSRLPDHVRTDEKRLRQILINLLSNAVKYTNAGSVRLSIAYRSQVATLDIEDTGIGIAAGDLERVFEPFERGSAPEVALQPGVGLGLAITRMLTQILGGNITATSKPGQGSCFRLRLFLPEPHERPAHVAARGQLTGYAGPRRSVLVIDDDHAQVFVLEALLHQLGFDVHAARNGAEGLALAQSLRPDLVLLDIHMPDASGWDVAERLRAAHGKALRIIIVSASANEFREDAHGEPSHDAFVSKPVDQKALLAEISRQLDLAWNPVDDLPELATAAVPTSAPDPGPGETREWMERIRHLARVGHIRGVEAALAEFEATVPSSAPTVGAMRQYARNFDLQSLLKLIDGQHPS